MLNPDLTAQVNGQLIHNITFKRKIKYLDLQRFCQKQTSHLIALKLDQTTNSFPGLQDERMRRERHSQECYLPNNILIGFNL